MSEQCVYDKNNKPCLIGDFVEIDQPNMFYEHHGRDIGNIILFDEYSVLIKFKNECQFYLPQEIINVNHKYSKENIQQEKKRIINYLNYKNTLKENRKKIFVINLEFDGFRIVPVYNCESSNISFWKKYPNKHDIIATFNDLNIVFYDNNCIILKNEQDFLNLKYRIKNSSQKFLIDEDFNKIFQFTKKGLKEFQKQLNIPFNKNQKKTIQLFKQKIQNI